MDLPFDKNIWSISQRYFKLSKENVQTYINKYLKYFGLQIQSFSSTENSNKDDCVD